MRSKSAFTAARVAVAAIAGLSSGAGFYAAYQYHRYQIPWWTCAIIGSAVVIFNILLIRLLQRLDVREPLN